MILLLGAFAGGVTVGERKARHFSNFSENYNHMFGPRHIGPGDRLPFGMPMLPEGHGVFGKVISVSGSNLVINGKDNVEQNVTVASSTAIRIGREDGTLADILPDTDVAVFGAPNDQGQIEARLIRIFDTISPR
jgi:hypothetical protein